MAESTHTSTDEAKPGDNKASDNRADRREQILIAALALFTQHGMAHVSTRQIARAVGISQPSLYAHFPNADAISTELCVRGFQQLHAAFATIMRQGGTPVQRLERLGQAYIDFALTHPDIYRLVFMAEMPEPEPGGEDAKMVEGMRAFAVLRDVVAEVLAEAGDGAETLVEVQAQSCWAGVHGLASLLLARCHFPWAEHKMLISAHLRNISRGVTGGE